MLSHEEMVGLQAEKHELIAEENYLTPDQYVLHLMHCAAYTYVARFVEGKSVLDLGCNTGYGTNILSARAKSIVGLDVSERAVEQARARYGSKGLKFEVGDGVRLPFDDGAFDVITGFQLIEQLVGYDSFINEVKRVLAPRGIVIFTTPNALLRLDPGMKPWNQFHVREFTPEDLLETMRGYFDQVTVLGLYASDHLYAIEFNRVDRARRIARNNCSGGAGRELRNSWRARVKGMLPEKALNFLRNVVLSRNGTLSLREIKENHGVEDFYYRAGAVNDALDFMAICSAVDVSPHVESILAQKK